MRVRSLLLLALFGFVLFLPGLANATTWAETASSFGYSAVDTILEGGNAYNWRTFTDSCKQIQYGTANPHDDSFESDDGSTNPVPLPIGFSFRFMGRYYTGVYVCTNGCILLVNDDNQALYAEQDAINSFAFDTIDSANFFIPRFFNDGTMIPCIMVWQEDMTALSSQLTWGVTTTGGNNELVITFRNLDYYSSQLSSQISCQVILQSSGKIILQYQTSINSTDSGNANADPAVGICGPDALGNDAFLPIYTRVANDGYPSAYSAITFFPPPPPPTVTVIHPNGGELFYTGGNVTVTWSVANGPLNGVDIAISTNGGGSWTTIATNEPDDGSFTWQITSAPSLLCLFRVSDTTLASTQDTSDSVFEIRLSPPGLTILTPGGTGNLDWVIGDVMPITWTFVGTVGSDCTLSVSRDQGITWETLATNINPKNTSNFNWTIDAPHTSGIRSCFIRLVDELGTTAVSNPPFAIFNLPVFDLTAPDGGETVFIDTPTNIVWQTQGLVGFFVAIQLSRDGGVNWETVTGGTNNDGDFPWTPTGPTTSTAKIRITTSYGGVTYSDTTTNLFTISETAALAVTNPNGGEVYSVGDNVSITWNSRGTGVGNFVKIEISRDGGQTFETISDSAQNIGYYSWTVTGPLSERALINISPINNPTANDVSDGIFQISAAQGMYLLSPLGGESYFTSEILNIGWFTSGATGNNVKIELSRDGGANWEEIIRDTPNDGTYSWVVSGDLSENCLIKVSSVTYPEFSSVSPAPFRISELLDVVFTEPFSGQIWESGTYRTIKWKTSIFESTSVRIEVLRAGEGWEVISVTTENDGIYDWFVSGINPECQIRISSLINLSKNHVSDIFAIVQRYSIDKDALGVDVTSDAGETVPFSMIVNPIDSFDSFEVVMNYDPAVVTIPEPLAIKKGGAFTGWVMNVNIDNTNGVLTVSLSGASAFMLPANAFTVNFSSNVNAPDGVYEVEIGSARFNGILSANITNGKITLNSVETANPEASVGGGGGCFIATAAFGAMTSGTVESLCSVRDSFAASSTFGSNLVSLYYELSPAVATHTSNSVRAIIREFLD